MAENDARLVTPKAMTRREIVRLLELLARMSEQQWVTGEERDEIAHLRHALYEVEDGDRG